MKLILATKVRYLAEHNYFTSKFYITDFNRKERYKSLLSNPTHLTEKVCLHICV